MTGDDAHRGTGTEERTADTSTGTESSATSRLSYLLSTSRPRFWLYLAGPVLVGVAYAAASPADLLAPATVALFAYFLAPANVFLYGINDVYDREVDAENPKKEEREVRYEGQTVVPVAVALCGALAAGFVALLPAAAWPWIALFLVLGAAYSAPPVRLKTTPLLDSVSNGLYVAPGVAAYAAVAGSQPPALAILGGWVWAMGMHTFSAIPDIGPDRAAGIRTTATVLGERRTYAYCGACWLVAAGAFAAVDPRLGAPLLVYPALVLAVATSSAAVDRAYWWFPAINAAVGALLTMGGLWRLVHG